MKWINIVSICILFFVQCSNQLPGNGDKAGEIIPSIDLLLVDSSTILNTRTLSVSAPIVILFFDPYCQYCRAETESILKNIKHFGNTQFCFLTVASFDDMKMFYKNYKLNQYPNIHIGRDTAAVYMNFFEIRKVPHTSVYTKNHILKRVFNSPVDASEVLSVLN